MLLLPSFVGNSGNWRKQKGWGYSSPPRMPRGCLWSCVRKTHPKWKRLVDYSSNVPFTTSLSFINSAFRGRLQTRLQEILQPVTKAEKLFENNFTVSREQKFSNCALFLSDNKWNLIPQYRRLHHPVSGNTQNIQCGFVSVHVFLLE